MIKKKAVLEILKDDRLYRLECDEDAPLGEVHDILCRMKAHIVHILNERQKQEDEKG